MNQNELLAYIGVATFFGMIALGAFFGGSVRTRATRRVNRGLGGAKATGNRFFRECEAFARKWEPYEDSISFPSPEYDAMMRELQAMIDLGNAAQSELKELIHVAGQGRTGQTSDLRHVLQHLNRPIRELEKTQLKMLKLQEKRKPQGRHARITFNCSSCNQPIDVNASASGSMFRCPTCGKELIVP